MHLLLISIRPSKLFEFSVASLLVPLTIRGTVFFILTPPRNLEEVDLTATAVKDGGVLISNSLPCGTPSYRKGRVLSSLAPHLG